MIGRIITRGRKSGLKCLSTGSLSPFSLPFPRYFFPQTIWNSCHTSMTIWYLVIIHEGSNDMARLTSIYQCLKLRTKIKWERTTNSMKLKFARSIKRKKGSKFTTNVLAKIKISGVTMVPYLTSKDFTLCLHLLHLNFIIVNFELIFRSGFPSIQQLSQWFSSCLCLHVYESFAVPKSFWRRLEYGC